MAQKSKDHVGKNPLAIGNVLVMVMFASLGIVDLIAAKYAEASVWLSLAAAFAFLGPESTPWPEMPKWRKAAGLVLVAVGAALFGFQIARDFTS